MNDLNKHLEYCEKILPKVSRTFALGVMALKGDLKRATLAGYLLCRIADTIEDDLKLPWAIKYEYLTTFLNCFEICDKIKNLEELSQQLTGDPAHIDLVKHANSVFILFFSLSARTQSILKKWIIEMTMGMKKFTKNHPQGIRIRSVSEFKEYCYFVAGTVGYLLTDLWKEYGVLISEKKYKKLSTQAGIFGEGLQSINILKDISWDIYKENQHYLPEEELKNVGLSHGSDFSTANNKKRDQVLNKMIKLATENLQTSLEYIASIPIINMRIRFFCILPLLLAFATLREIKRARSLFQPDTFVKISRKEVKHIYKHSLISCLSNTYLKHFATKCLADGLL